MNSGIYAIINNINGSMYIGSSICIKGRLYRHLNDLRNGIHYNQKLQRAFNKYGESNLEFIPVYFCNAEELLKFEQLFIDTVGPEYNILPTAGSPLGYKHPREFGDAIRIRQTGKIPNQSTRDKIGNANRGYKHTPEAIAKIAEASKGRIKPIKTYDGFISPEGIEYKNIKDLKRFCQQYDLNYSNMNQVDNGHKRVHRGWKRINASSNQTSGS